MPPGEALMAEDAKYYAVSKGTQGDDIQRIQQRLYELGYLAKADQVTGNFGDSTEAAVIKLPGGQWPKPGWKGRTENL